MLLTNIHCHQHGIYQYPQLNRNKIKVNIIVKILVFRLLKKIIIEYNKRENAFKQIIIINSEQTGFVVVFYLNFSTFAQIISFLLFLYHIRCECYDISHK